MTMAELDFISDILLGFGALAAAFYCVVLARKLNRLSGLDQELGSAIAVLSKQVDEMTAVLHEAQVSADDASSRLGELTERAEDAAARLQTHPVVSEGASDHEEPNQPPQPPVSDEDNVQSVFFRHSRAST